MYMEKKVHISWRLHKCYKCDEETVTTGGGNVNGWAPMSRREPSGFVAMSRVADRLGK